MVLNIERHHDKLHAIAPFAQAESLFHSTLSVLFWYFCFLFATETTVVFLGGPGRRVTYSESGQIWHRTPPGQ